MIKRLKNTPRLAWMVVGGCIVALVIPSAAVASGLIYNGIKGPSGNKADVTTASQLLTAPASPANYYAGADVNLVATNGADVASPPAGDGLVVTSINLSVYSVSSPGSSNANFFVGPSGCASFVGPFQHGVYPNGIGSSEITFNPGIVIPNGDVLCGAESGVGAYAEATGYVGSSTAIP
jgi:hypothetical protein